MSLESELLDGESETVDAIAVENFAEGAPRADDLTLVILRFR